MKLFLTSYRIPAPEDLFKLVNKKPSEISVAIIPNAKDYYAERARNFKINEMTEFIANFGMKPELLDLREYNDATSLKEKLAEKQLIWVSGGNTFCLRYEMKRSGFDKVIDDILSAGVVYAGESAGACVAGTTLKGLEGADEPAFAEDQVWEGLNLLPNFVLPHADNPMFADDTKQTLELYKNDPKLITLNDNQALVVDNGQSRVVTGMTNES